MEQELIIDIQGYRNGAKFVCKELAVASIKPFRTIAHFVFITPRGLRNWTRTNDWLISNHHSLRYEQGDVPYSRIRQIFKRVLGEHKTRVFVKGFEKTRWIKQYFNRPIDIVDLINYPPLHGPEYTEQPSCSFLHRKCALQNALKLLHYILDEDQMNGRAPTMVEAVGENSDYWSEPTLPDEDLSLLRFLITRVKKRPCLYDGSLNEDEDTQVQMDYWDEIAKDCKLPKDVVLTKWKSLIDQYSEERRLLLKKKTGWGVTNLSSEWPLFHQMQFLDPYVFMEKSNSYPQPTNAANVESSGLSEENVDNDLKRNDELESLIIDDVSSQSKYQTPEEQRAVEKDICAKGFVIATQTPEYKKEKKDEFDEDDAFAENLMLELKKLKSGKAKKRLKMGMYILLYTFDEEEV